MKPIRTISQLADMSNFALKKMIASKREHYMEKWYGRAVLCDKAMLDKAHEKTIKMRIIREP